MSSRVTATPSLMSEDVYGVKVYVGSYVHSRNTRVLKELNIKAILCVKSKCRFRDGYLCEHIPISDFGDMDLIGGYKEESKENDDNKNISPSNEKRTKNYLTPTRDSGGPPPLYRCAAFLSRCAGQGLNVLIHCSSGVNRATTIAVGLYMLLKHMTLKQSFNMVRRSRPCMSPHERYFKQLQALDRRLQGGELSLTREEAGPSLQQIVRDSIKEEKNEQEKNQSDRPKSALDLLRSDLEKKEKELQRLRDELATTSSSTPSPRRSRIEENDDDGDDNNEGETPRRVLAFSDDAAPIPAPPKAALPSETKKKKSTPLTQRRTEVIPRPKESSSACSCVLL